MSLKIAISPKQFLEKVSDESSSSAAKKKNYDENEKRKLDERIKELQKQADEIYKKSEEQKNAYKFDEMEYDGRSDDELRAQAEKDINEKYDLKADALIEENEQKDKALKEKQEEIALNAEKLNEATENRYEAAKENASNDAIKRGIARSSIISGILKEYDKEKLTAIENRSATAEKQISDIDDRISELQQGLNASLKKYDMEKAIEINEKLDELKAEREKKNAEVLKYNNQVKQNLLKYADKLKEAAGEDEYAKQIGDIKRQMAFSIADYYAGLDKQTAINDFEKSGYDKLLTPEGLKMVRTYLKLMND